MKVSIKKLFKFSIMFLALFLTGCGLIFGEKIHEEETGYSQAVTFKFNLDEGQITHYINIVVGFSKTGIPSARAQFCATLTAPNGTSQIESFRVAQSGVKKRLHTTVEQNIFQITPQQGEYTITIKELNKSDFNGESIALKVYKKEE